MSRLRWDLALRARSPALLGAVRSEQSGAHLAAGTLRLEGSTQTLLIGSTLRGVLRHDLRRLLAARGQDECEQAGLCTCLACWLFGTTERPGKVAVRSARAPATRQHSIARVAVDGDRRTALRESGALWSELRLQADFLVELEALADLTDEEAKAIELLLAWERAIGLRLGHARRAGAGVFELDWARAELATRAKAARVGSLERRSYAVRFTTEEPLQVTSLRQRAFLSVSTEAVPVTTVRGAIGWGLVRSGEEDAAADLFRERPIRLTGAVAAIEGERPAAGALVCRSNPQHLIDITAHQVAVALGHAARWPLECPKCQAALKVPKGGSPERLLLGHTAIDPVTLRPAHGQLFYQLTIPPGTVLVAEADMTADQASTIASLGQVLLGAGRARGMGRARVEVEERPPLAPLEERIERTASALSAAGAVGTQGVAVLSFVSDGWCEQPVRELLASRQLSFVTGNARRVLQGGWDLGRGAQRPLRALIGAGSWVAVRGPADAVAELESAGIDDPEGTHPVWLRARDLQGERA